MHNQDIFIHHCIINGDQTHSLLDEAFIQQGSKLKKGQLVWQHIDLNNANSHEWLENHSGLESIAFNSLTAEETRPRSFKVKDGLMVILRGLNMNPGQDVDDMVSIRLLIQKDRVVSVRRRRIAAIQDIIADLSEGDGPRSAGEFLTTLINKMANRVGDFVNSIDDELSDAEERLEELEASELRALLGSLRRQIAVVRRYMAPQRDALDRLNHLDSGVLNERDRQLLREESDRVSRYLEDLDLARERAVVLQEAFLSQIAQEQNTRMYALSILSAIFLPLGFLTGLLGINVGGMPGADSGSAFWVFVVSLVFIVGFQYWLFKKLKWF